MPWWATGARPPLNGSVMGTKLGFGTSIVGCQLGGCVAQACGLPLVSNWLGNSFWNAQRGMTLPPAPVYTLQCTLPSWLGPMTAGIFMVVKASALMLVSMSVIVIYSGWLLVIHGHVGVLLQPCWLCQLGGCGLLQHLPHLVICIHIVGSCSGSHLASSWCLLVSWWLVGHHCFYSIAASGLYSHIQNTWNP